MKWCGPLESNNSYMQQNITMQNKYFYIVYKSTSRSPIITNTSLPLNEQPLVYVHLTDDHEIILKNITPKTTQSKSTHLWCHIYASMNRFSIASGNGLSPVQRQAITQTNAVLFSGINFSEIRIKIQNFSLMKIHF